MVAWKTIKYIFHILVKVLVTWIKDLLVDTTTFKKGIAPLIVPQWWCGKRSIFFYSNENNKYVDNRRSWGY